jgi:tetratricopeptide (TPR) repeat protein
LGNIDPSWPCFSCITCEHASALLHAGEAAAAETFCREQQGKLLADGRSGDSGIRARLVDALERQGRHEDALRLLETQPGAHEQLSVKIEYQLQRARLLAALDQPTAARAAFDAVDTLDASEFVSWGRTVHALCRVGALTNDTELGRQLRGFTRQLEANGALYDLAWLLVLGATLATLRNAAAVAVLYRDAAVSVLPKLRKADDLTALLERLSIAPTSPVEVADPDALLASLSEDPETNLTALQAAHHVFPDHEGVLIELANTYWTLGFTTIAADHVRAFVARQPQAVSALDELLQMLVALDRADELDALAPQVPTDQRARVLFYQARSLRQRGKWDECIARLEAARELKPESLTIAQELAFAYRSVERWQEALALLSFLVERSEPGDHDWDRMVVATVLDEHEIVRASAARLGYQFEGTGPIDQAYEYCNLRTRDAFGEEKALRAVRISPVVGRIVQLTGPKARERYQDWVLFEPASLNEPATTDDDGGEEEKPAHVHEFNELRVLREGGYRSYELDGFHPGEAAIDALCDDLEAVGGALSIRNSDAYRLRAKDADQDAPGIYAYIAVPRSTSTAAFHEWLCKHTDRWAQPVTYRGLLTELGLTEELARQEALARELDL